MAAVMCLFCFKPHPLDYALAHTLFAGEWAAFKMLCEWLCEFDLAGEGKLMAYV